MRISDDHVDRWRRQGYTIVERFLSEAELAALQPEIAALFPSWYQYSADPFSALAGGYLRDAPALGPRLNLVALHPELIDFVERALGTIDLTLTQAQMSSRYTGSETLDQALHVDFMNSSILYPSSVSEPEQVTMTLYYTDMALDLGPTYVVPRDQTENEPMVPYIRPRNQYPNFYKLEQPVMVPAGSLLIYGLRTFHRESAPTRPYGTRLTHHIAYRRAEAQWVGYSVWATAGLSEDWQRLLESASLRQQEALGVPPPGHVYWNPETVAGMAARYPLIDMRRYAEAANVPYSVVEAERKRIGELPPIDETTSSTGVTTRIGLIRQSIRAMGMYSPEAAAYYQGALDVYEKAAAAYLNGATENVLVSRTAKASD